MFYSVKSVLYFHPQKKKRKKSVLYFETEGIFVF